MFSGDNEASDTESLDSDWDMMSSEMEEISIQGLLFMKKSTVQLISDQVMRLFLETQVWMYISTILGVSLEREQ
jgi:hypothetical protein